MAEPESLTEKARAGARRWLEQCGIDPDDLADVRRTYELARESYASALVGNSTAVINDEAYWNLVGAIKVANGWDQLPLEWPAENLLPAGGDGR